TEEGAPLSLRYSIDVANFLPKEGYRGKLYVIDKNSKALESSRGIAGTRGRESGEVVAEEISLWTAQLLEFER
ncbi:MAG: hypothetical protein QXZ30_02385, partial [Candidatus Bilamarchaeaceae archaeon]